MIEREITLQNIKKSLFDPSQIERSEDTRWRIGSDARPLSSFPPDRKGKIEAMLSPSSLKLERISRLDSSPEVVIGGLCSIFTGDLISGNLKDAVSQARMDQIVESVGNVSGKPTFIVIEDSFFERLTGLPRIDIQRQAKTVATCINRWLKLSTGQPPDMCFAYTSDPAVEKGLADAVGYLATEVLKNPDFKRIQAAPILMMYTSFWPELLSSLGIIPSSNVVCVEPIIHFIDDRSFPDKKLNRAYFDFLQWLGDNPYGENGSRNQTFGVAGFLESYAGDQTKKRTRLLPFTDVPTTANYRRWTEQLSANAERFPFPLRNSLVFAEAVNWGLWDPEIRECVGALIGFEEEYYSKKKSIGAKKNDREVNQECAQRLRTILGGQVKPFSLKLSRKIENIVTTVLGD